MKLMIRSTLALACLIAFATPLLAQGPYVAVRIGKPSQSCFPVMLKNLRTTPVKFQTAYITIFDQSTCKVSCEFKMPLEKKLDPCKTLEFRMCCQKPLPAKYICYVRVFHNLGSNEQWFFAP